MRTQDLDLFTGSELKKVGMHAASQHADRVHEGWSDQAYAMLKQYIRVVRGDFLCEDLRAYAYLHGLPVPPSNRAWGSVIGKAKRANLIKPNGTDKYKIRVPIWLMPAYGGFCE